MDSPHERPEMQSFDTFCCCWTTNQGAGDLSRHDAYVTSLWCLWAQKMNFARLQIRWTQATSREGNVVFVCENDKTVNFRFVKCNSLNSRKSRGSIDAGYALLSNKPDREHGVWRILGAGSQWWDTCVTRWSNDIETLSVVLTHGIGITDIRAGNPIVIMRFLHTLLWCHNERDGFSNHRPHDCLLNRLFRRTSKKTPNLRVTGLREGNPPVIGEFPAQRPVMRNLFPFDDVIMKGGKHHIFHLWSWHRNVSG